MSSNILPPGFTTVNKQTFSEFVNGHLVSFKHIIKQNTLDIEHLTHIVLCLLKHLFLYYYNFKIDEKQLKKASHSVKNAIEFLDIDMTKEPSIYVTPLIISSISAFKNASCILLTNEQKTEIKQKLPELLINFIKDNHQHHGCKKHSNGKHIEKQSEKKNTKCSKKRGGSAASTVSDDEDSDKEDDNSDEDDSDSDDEDSDSDEDDDDDTTITSNSTSTRSRSICKRNSNDKCEIDVLTDMLNPKQLINKIIAKLFKTNMTMNSSTKQIKSQLLTLIDKLPNLPKTQKRKLRRDIANVLNLF